MRHSIIWLAMLISALLGLLVWHTSTPRWADAGTVQVGWQGDQQWDQDNISLHWQADEAQLTISHDGSNVWASSPGEPWLGAARADEAVTQSAIRQGVLRRLVDMCVEQEWHEVTAEDGRIQMSGLIQCGNDSLPARFSIYQDDYGDLRLDWAVEGDLAVTFLDFAVDPAEAFFGFGQQSGAWNKRGERILLYPDEASNGADALSRLPNPWPVTLTSRGRVFLSPQPGRQVMDLRPGDSGRLENWSRNDGSLILSHAESPRALLTILTERLGRMPGLPAWAHAAPVVGTTRQGAEVEAMLRDLRSEGTPLAGVLLELPLSQGMPVGAETLPWRPGRLEQQSADWASLSAYLEAEGLALMGSRAPLIHQHRVDNLPMYRDASLPVGDSVVPESEDARTEGLYRLDTEASQAGDWLDEQAFVSGDGAPVRGWFVDMSPPVDEAMQSASLDTWGYTQARNWYDWSRNQSASDDALLMLSRALFPGTDTGSQPHTVASGQQQTSWSADNGLQASLTALLSGGVSGIPVGHSLVGGTYSTRQLWTRQPRSMELFLRWLELNTFTAWLRLHEGSTPNAHYQVTDSVAGRIHFDRMARLYAALHPYRETLMAEAREQGIPLVRPLWLEYPDDLSAWELPADQFLLGSHLLVVPVLESGMNQRTFYVPEGEWTHLWDRRTWDSSGEWLTLRAPIGEPLVLVHRDFPGREALLSTAADLAIGDLMAQ